MRTSSIEEEVEQSKLPPAGPPDHVGPTGGRQHAERIALGVLSRDSLVSGCMTAARGTAGTWAARRQRPCGGRTGMSGWVERAYVHRRTRARAPALCSKWSMSVTVNLPHRSTSGQRSAPDASRGGEMGLDVVRNETAGRGRSSPTFPRGCRRGRSISVLGTIAERVARTGGDDGALGPPAEGRSRGHCHPYVPGQRGLSAKSVGRTQAHAEIVLSTVSDY